jgi:hypothetical protein
MSFTHRPVCFAAAVVFTMAAKRWLIKSQPELGSRIGKIG